MALDNLPTVPFVCRNVTIEGPRGTRRAILKTNGTETLKDGFRIPLAETYPGCNISVDMTYPARMPKRPMKMTPGAVAMLVDIFSGGTPA